MKEFITDHGVEFEKTKGFKFNFATGCLITPIWKRGYIVRLLVTDKSSGKATYIDTKTKCIRIERYCSVVKLPQGLTYDMSGLTSITALNIWIIVS